MTCESVLRRTTHTQTSNTCPVSLTETVNRDPDRCPCRCGRSRYALSVRGPGSVYCVHITIRRLISMLQPLVSVFELILHSPDSFVIEFRITCERGIEGERTSIAHDGCKKCPENRPGIKANKKIYQRTVCSSWKHGDRKPKRQRQQPEAILQPSPSFSGISVATAIPMSEWYPPSTVTSPSQPYGAARAVTQPADLQVHGSQPHPLHPATVENASLVG